MVMAQLLSRYAISLPGARPVLPAGRVTIEPSYEPLFRFGICLSPRGRGARRDHSGARRRIYQFSRPCIEAVSVITTSGWRKCCACRCSSSEPVCACM